MGGPMCARKAMNQQNWLALRAPARSAVGRQSGWPYVRLQANTPAKWVGPLCTRKAMCQQIELALWTPARQYTGKMGWPLLHPQGNVWCQKCIHGRAVALLSVEWPSVLPHGGVLIATHRPFQCRLGALCPLVMARPEISVCFD
eukprot:1159199-Pelagomonas_calceolata.AAC.4